MTDKREKVFICINLRPHKDQPPEEQKKEMEENVKRARVAARYAALNGFDPEVTTIYFTQFLDDFLKEERQIGMSIGKQRLLACDRFWWIKNDGADPPPETSGKWEEKRLAEANGIPIEYKDYEEIADWIEKNSSLV